MNNLLKIPILLIGLFLINTNGYSTIDTVTNTATSGPGSLWGTIGLASSGDTVRFHPNLISSGSDTIVLQNRFINNKSLHIVGLYNSNDTLYISGDSTFRIFEVTNTPKLTLDSLVLINGYGVGSTSNGNGGAILFQDSDTLIINNSIIRGNTATGDGGGIYIVPSIYVTDSTSLELNNSIISNNTCSNGYGGGISHEFDGNNQGTAFISILNSVLINNSCTNGTGGALSCYSASTSKDNYYVTINNSSFNNNSTASNVVGCGGILFTSLNSVSLMMVNSEIKDNVGRGISSESKSCNITVTNSHINGNTGMAIFSKPQHSSIIAVDSSEINLNGGGIFQYTSNSGSSSIITVSNTKIMGNKSNSSGGGIHSSSNTAGSNFASVILSNSTVCGNSAIGSGGGISCYSNKTDLTITNSNVDGNSATSNGGGIYANGNLSRIINSTINNNVAGIDGGGIYSDSVLTNNSTINNNVATNGNGGGVCVDSWFGYPYISLINTYVKGNKSNISGGGIFAYTDGGISPYSTVVIDSSEISNNITDLYGGGIYCHKFSTGGQSNLTLSNSTVNNNTTVNGNGGGIFCRKITANNSVISNNSAAYFGGGFVGGYLSLANSIVNNNAATNSGGGIYTDYTTSSSYLLIDSCTFINNTAGDDGGGIFADFYTTLTLNYTVTHSTFNNNTSTTGDGGGIYSKDQTINLINSTIVGNNAPNGLGEGIFLSNPSSANIDIKGSIVAQNGTNNISINNSSTPTIISQGYNIFSDAPAGTLPTDQLNITAPQLNLQALAYYGGTTPTLSPVIGSVAINMGDPSDITDAQNRPINGIREVGAAEYCTQSTSSTISTTACNSYSSPSGFYTWVSSGSYTDIIPNAVGCDSIITINLTIDSSATTLNPITCDSYTSPSGNYTWNCSGTYMDTIPNAFGCDSIFTINLTVADTSSSTINPIACNTYTSPSGNYTWTGTGTYMDTIANVLGCDSIITINLTIGTQATSSTITPTACDSYTSPSGIYTWTSTGNYKDTLVNAIGCDSVITINLTVNNVDTSTSTNSIDTITSNATTATYQWLDCNNNFAIISGETNAQFISSTPGSFAVQVTQNGCIDTSACILLSSVGINENNSLNGVNIYPNPTNGELNVIIDDYSGTLNYSITTIDGKLIRQQQSITGKKIHIDLQNETKGIYFFKIEDDVSFKVYKIIMK